jgi:hypothetical protein
MVQNTTMSQASRVVLLSRSTLLCGDASAKDMKMLVDTLAGNFLAQQVSSICAVDSKSFVKETSGVLGDTSSYAERVKQEIVSGLAPNEANAIVSDAASKARGEALQLIGRLSVDGQVQPGKLASWCRTVGKPFILQLESIYDTRHSYFERELDNAKR